MLYGLYIRKQLIVRWILTEDDDSMLNHLRTKLTHNTSVKEVQLNVKRKFTVLIKRINFLLFYFTVFLFLFFLFLCMEFYFGFSPSFICHISISLHINFMSFYFPFSFSSYLIHLTVIWPYWEHTDSMLTEMIWVRLNAIKSKHGSMEIKTKNFEPIFW